MRLPILVDGGRFFLVRILPLKEEINICHQDVVVLPLCAFYQSWSNPSD
jgi:hypothetical protein